VHDVPALIGDDLDLRLAPAAKPAIVPEPQSLLGILTKLRRILLDCFALHKKRAVSAVHRNSPNPHIGIDSDQLTTPQLERRYKLRLVQNNFDLVKEKSLWRAAPRQ